MPKRYIAASRDSVGVGNRLQSSQIKPVTETGGTDKQIGQSFDRFTEHCLVQWKVVLVTNISSQPNVLSLL